MAAIATKKKASLWIAGRSPFVKRMSIAIVNMSRVLNHAGSHPKYIATVSNTVRRMRKISFVSK
jgi:hypothetical protein